MYSSCPWPVGQEGYNLSGQPCQMYTTVVKGFNVSFLLLPCRTRVKLESLEDAYILRGNDDSLSDKHGCPAYVSPEILNTNGSYSGKAADVWSLGVMLYTMLVGRYPFHDIEPSSLFSKIRRGQFSIPETLSPKAKCLIRSILRREPSERLTSQEILDHPWFSTDFNVSNSGYGAKEVTDQMVPDVNMEEDSDPFFNWALELVFGSCVAWKGPHKGSPSWSRHTISMSVPALIAKRQLGILWGCKESPRFELIPHM